MLTTIGGMVLLLLSWIALGNADSKQFIVGTVANSVCGGLSAGDPIPHGDTTAPSQWSSSGIQNSTECPTDDTCLTGAECNVLMDGYLPAGALFYAFNFPNQRVANTGYIRPSASQVYMIQDETDAVSLLMVHSNTVSAGGGKVGVEVTTRGTSNISVIFRDNASEGSETSDCLNPNSVLDCYDFDPVTQSGQFGWNFAECCTDGIVLGEFPLEGYAISLQYFHITGPTRVQFITYEAGDVVHHAVENDVAEDGVLLEGFECQGLCEGLTNCGDCVEATVCSWCRSTESCFSNDIEVISCPLEDMLSFGLCSRTVSVSSSFSFSSSVSFTSSHTSSISVSGSATQSHSLTASVSASASPSWSPGRIPCPIQACASAQCTHFRNCSTCRVVELDRCAYASSERCDSGFACDVISDSSSELFNCISAQAVGDGVRDCFDGADEGAVTCGLPIDGFNPQGNGVKDASEGCDDGNLTDGDGCSALCTVEDGFVCSGPIGARSECRNVTVPSVEGVLALCLDIPLDISNRTLVEQFIEAIAAAYQEDPSRIQIQVTNTTLCPEIYFVISFLTVADAEAAAAKISNLTVAMIRNDMVTTLGRDISDIVLKELRVVVPPDRTLQPVVFALRSSNPQDPLIAGESHIVSLVPVFLGEPLALVSVVGLRVSEMALDSKIQFKNVSREGTGLRLFTVSRGLPSGQVGFRVDFEDFGGNSRSCLSANATCVGQPLRVDLTPPSLSLSRFAFHKPRRDSFVLQLELWLSTNEEVNLVGRNVTATCDSQDCSATLFAISPPEARVLSVQLDISGFSDGADVVISVGAIVADSAGNLNIPQTITVRLPQLDYVDDAVYFGVVIVAGLIAITSIASVAAIYRFRNLEKVRTISPTFSILVILGFLLTLSSIPVGGVTRLNWSVAFRDKACAAFPHIVANAILAILSPLIVKNWRLHKIFNNKRLRVLFLDNRLLFKYMLAIWLPGLSVMVLWGGIYSSSAAVDLDSLVPTCTRRGSFLLWLEFAYTVGLMVAGACLCYRIWQLPDQYNEAKPFVWACASLCVVAAIVVPVFFFVGDDVDGWFLLVSIASIAVAAFPLVFLFVIRVPVAVIQAQVEGSPSFGPRRIRMTEDEKGVNPARRAARLVDSHSTHMSVELSSAPQRTDREHGEGENVHDGTKRPSLKNRIGSHIADVRRGSVTSVDGDKDALRS